MVAAPNWLDPADPADASPLQAWLAFQSVFAWRPVEAARLLARYSDPTAALRASGASPAAGFDAPAALGALRRAGAVGLCLHSPAYPRRLRRLADAPPLLLVRGACDVLAARAVAIVGSRAATGYGRSVARDLARALGASGIVVVSGLARGVDAAAHAGALETGGLTVAVQACGPDRVYPAAHRRLAARIAESGAVVSELPPGAPPRKQHFPFRNRIISALSEAVVVVEARERSGSLITARHALDQGLDVFAVPGPITAPTSRGPNELLRDGATPLLDASDLLEALGVPAAPAGPCGPAPRRSAGQRAIVDALCDEPATRDVLARRLGLPAAELALALVELELDGCVIEDRDGRLRVPTARAGGWPSGYAGLRAGADRPAQPEVAAGRRAEPASGGLDGQPVAPAPRDRGRGPRRL